MRSFAIIPAAGHSRRMGEPKLLLPWGDSTVIGHTLAGWKASGVTKVLVVVRPGDDALARACHGLAEVVVPPSDPPDMKTSVLHGLDYIREHFAPTDGDVWLLAPADMPRISAEVIDLVLRQYSLQSPHIVAPTHEGRRGHPVLFPWPLATEVSRLAVNEGVNTIVHRHSVQLVECPDAAILDDLDTPADYARQQNRRRPD